MQGGEWWWVERGVETSGLRGAGWLEECGGETC